jgi:hypothetical protein
MGFLENLKVLELVIIKVDPEDVEILGAIPIRCFCMVCVHVKNMERWF